MASSLTTLRSGLTTRLGTSESAFYTNDKKNAALNSALLRVVKRYDVPQYRSEVSLSFTSGEADLPTDVLRPRMLHGSNMSDVYEIIDFEKFRGDISQTATIKWDNANSKEIIKIYPASTTTLTFVYMEQPDALTDDSDTIRLNTYWDEALQEYALYFLLRWGRNFQEAQAQKMIADQYLAEAWQTEQNRLNGRLDNRVQSVFAYNSFITRFHKGVSNTTTSS